MNWQDTSSSEKAAHITGDKLTWSDTYSIASVLDRRAVSVCLEAMRQGRLESVLELCATEHADPKERVSLMRGRALYGWKPRYSCNGYGAVADTP
jgi:hypothetical protein